MKIAYRLEETLLTLRDVRLTLSGRVVLDGVSATVKNVTRPGVLQGQVVGILGPSGIGKTQLFRILAGLQRPDAGAVLVGRDQKSVVRGTVGVVAQDYPLFEHRTVLDNMTIACRARGAARGRIDEQCHAMLERFGVAEQATRFPALLSGGQRQRVAIAQQLLARSELLLMDEPFSGLDVRMVREACALIREVSQRDELLTIVIVSHDIDAVLSVADTVWLLGRGGGCEPGSGARIVEVIDLMEQGLAWQPDGRTLPHYAEVRRAIEARFLSP